MPDQNRETLLGPDYSMPDQPKITLDEISKYMQGASGFERVDDRINDLEELVTTLSERINHLEKLVATLLTYLGTLVPRINALETTGGPRRHAAIARRAPPVRRTYARGSRRPLMVRNEARCGVLPLPRYPPTTRPLLEATGAGSGHPTYSYCRNAESGRIAASSRGALPHRRPDLTSPRVARCVALRSAQNMSEEHPKEAPCPGYKTAA